MMKIGFFAHDAQDAAVLRRVRAFEQAGFDVTGFSMRRAARAEDCWSKIDLGRTYHGRFAHRMQQVYKGVRIAATHRDLLSSCDVIYARNLDMLLCAHRALTKCGLAKPLVYECLDIHRLMHRPDIIGAAMRRLERRLLAETSLLVVSSPAFLRGYFEIRHTGFYSARLVENRIAGGAGLAVRPTHKRPISSPLRIGWMGVLRCRRSLSLMEALAQRFGAEVEIHLHGMVDIALSDFDQRIARHENLHFHGAYRSPQDLSKLYESIDVVWAGDFHDAGFNSKWLLPNRIYEGGYFATPAIAPADCETGRWLEERNIGFTLVEPLEENFPTLIEKLTSTPGLVKARQRRLLAAPADMFVQPVSEIRDVILQVCENFSQNLRSMPDTPIQRSA